MQNYEENVAEDSPITDEHPEADALDQRTPVRRGADPDPEPMSQTEASDGDLADQAQPVVVGDEDLRFDEP